MWTEPLDRLLGVVRRTRPIFFCHIPKTGGTSLRFAMEAAVEPHLTLPSPAMMALCGGHYPSAEILAESLRREANGFRLVRGHYHLSIRTLLRNPVSVVVLRDPVSRVISNLRHNIQYNSMTAAEIIADLERGETRGVPTNQMTRYLGGSIERGAPAHIAKQNSDLLYGPMTDGSARLASAIAALETIDILGDTADIPGLAADLGKIGVTLPQKRENVSAVSLDLTDAHKERIRELNGLDVELYEHARRRT